MSARQFVPAESAALTPLSYTPTHRGLLQRKCPCTADNGRYEDECAECSRARPPAQRATSAGRTNNPGVPRLAPPLVHEVLRGSAQPLDPSIRASMESRFGHDFSQVRVHSDPRAGESARALDALAFTVGEHIVFQSGRYDPVSAEGRRLLAHELTHVLQQRAGRDQLAGCIPQGGPATVSPVTQPRLSRQSARYPGAISKCREIGVPCPAPYATHGTICRLADCIPAATARLPGAISPGICIYHCEDGKVCACVLVGTRTNAICTFTFCDEPGQAAAEPDPEAIGERALAIVERQYGTPPERTAEGATAQARLEIGAAGDAYEREADRTADRVVSMSDHILARPNRGEHRDSGSLVPAGTPLAAVSPPRRSLLQRQGGGPAACPQTMTFTFTEPAHVPHCGGPALRAVTGLAGMTWSLEPDTAAVDPGSAISANGTITLADTQPAGEIKARATAAAPAAVGCFVEQAFRIRSHPTGIASTRVIAPAGGTEYGASFEHVFDSADGNVASLEGVGVGERFTNVPNPPAAVHAIIAPLFPFGGTFNLSTATLTPNAANNWFLTAAGELGGTNDNVTIGQAHINVGRFVQSGSNPNPPQGLPAGFTLRQALHWFCPQRPAPTRWIPFVTVAHTRTIRNVAGQLEVVTAVNGVEQVDSYVGPTAVFNLTATPASTPRSAGGPPGGGAAPAPRTIRLRADTLPAALPGGQAIAWSIVAAALGCTVTPDPADDHAATLTVGATAGTLTVQAADSTNTNRARVAIVIT